MGQSKLKTTLELILRIPFLLIGYAAGMVVWSIMMVLCVGALWVIFLVITWLAGHRGV